jgi:hypothetical protein
MTFTYTAGSSTDANRVRLLIGDTDSAASPQLADEEITDLLTMYGTYRAAAAGAADALAAKCARLATQKSMGQASLMWDRFNQLTKLAKSLRDNAARSAVPFAGGMSRSLRNTNDQDTDAVFPRFRTGMLDDPTTLINSSTST